MSRTDHYLQTDRLWFLGKPGTKEGECEIRTAEERPLAIVSPSLSLPATLSLSGTGLVKVGDNLLWDGRIVQVGPQPAPPAGGNASETAIFRRRIIPPTGTPNASGETRCPYLLDHSPNPPSNLSSAPAGTEMVSMRVELNLTFGNVYGTPAGTPPLRGEQ